MFCGKCGSQIEDSSMFCPLCGANQQQFQQAPLPEGSDSSQSYQNSEQSFPPSSYQADREAGPAGQPMHFQKGYAPTETTSQQTGGVPYIPYDPQAYGPRPQAYPQGQFYPGVQSYGGPDAPPPGAYPGSFLQKPENPAAPGQAEASLFAVIKNGIQELIRHPAKLLPTLILAVVWIALSLLSALGKDVPGLRWLAMLTYSNGGMYGGILGGMGGIFGKAVFAAVVNTLVLSFWKGENPFAPAKNRNGGLVRQAAVSGLNNVAPFICGAGAGLILYCFFNVTSSTANWMVGLVAAAGAIQAAISGNGLFFLIIVEIVRRLSGNRTPSSQTIHRSLAGLSAGFAVGIPLTFMRQPLMIFGAGIILLLLGILLAVLGNHRARGMAAMMLCMAALGVSIGSALFPLSAEAAGKAPTAEEICGTYTCDSQRKTFGEERNPKRNISVTIKQEGGKLILYAPSDLKEELEFTYNSQTGKGQAFQAFAHSVNGFSYVFNFSKISNNTIKMEVFGKFQRNKPIDKGNFIEIAVTDMLKRDNDWVKITGRLTAPDYPPAPAPQTAGINKDKEPVSPPAGEFPPAESGNNPDRALSDEEYDHSNLPDTEREIAGVAAVTALGGAALGLGGAAAGAGAGGVSGGLGGAAGNFGPHLSLDADGDLHITDSTGRERVYINQGDGTYREVGGFGFVTRRDLEEEATRLQENAGYYQQIETQRQEGLEEQRRQSREMSETMKQLLAGEQEAKADLQREQYMEKLRQKYGTYEDDDLLRKRMQENMDQAAEQAKKQARIAENYDTALKVAETTQLAADVGVSVLATVTGQVGISNAYTAAKNMADSLSDAVAKDKNLGIAVAQGALNTVADLTTNKLESAGWHVTGNAASAGFKKLLDNACNNKPLGEGVVTSAAFGGLGGAVSKGADSLSQWTEKGVREAANSYVHGGMTGMRHLGNGKICSEAGYRAVENIRLTALMEGVQGMRTANALGSGLVEGSKWAFGKIGETIQGE